MIDIIKNLIWAAVAIVALYWVGKPLAEGVSHWMTQASPDKFLESVFSFPSAIVVVLLFIGPGRIKGFVDRMIERGGKVGPVEIAPPAPPEFQTKPAPPTEQKPLLDAATPQRGEGERQ